MLTNQFTLGLHHEITVDLFAGGGGTSTGIELGIGRHVDVAINHDPEAISLHEANHPQTTHYVSDVFAADPGTVADGRPVGLLWASPDCFPAGTMVLTRDGYRAIEHVQIGDEVLTHKQRWRSVTSTMSAVRPLMRIRGQGHPGLLVSPEHPFYSRQRRDVWQPSSHTYRRTLDPAGWVAARDLGRGSYWASPCNFPADKTPPIPVYGLRTLKTDAKLLWLAGLYIADGWTRLTDTKAELVITCGRHEVDRLRTALSQWPRKGNRCTAEELTWHERETYTAYQFTTSHRGLVEWLRQHFGHGAASKLIPGWALGIDPELRGALLAGYLSGDDCLSKGDGTPLVMCSTVSKALAFGLKALASSLGHSPAVYVRTNQPDVIEGRKVNVLPAWSVCWRPEPERAQSFRDGGLNWAPVRKSEDVEGMAEVFNISVEDDESYVVEGIIVHNCTFHSKARGGKPHRDRDLARRRRALAWVVAKWAKHPTARPRVIIIENVEEFQHWGPLLDDGMPDPERRGQSFERWVAQLRNAGYKVEWRELRACDFGAPTIRKRLFIIARRDGLPIVWPEASHVKPDSEGRVPKGKLPWRTAAECIDWSIPCPSIFERKKPLADATLRRIAKGLVRYVIDADKPFIVRTTQGEPENRKSATPSGPAREPGSAGCSSTDRQIDLGGAPFIVTNTTGHPGAAITEPVRTVTTGGHHALVVPTLIQVGYGERPSRWQCIGCGFTYDRSDLPVCGCVKCGSEEDPVERPGQSPRVPGLDKPLGTVVTGQKHALVTAFLAKHYTGVVGSDLAHPLGTVTTIDHHSFVAVHMTKFNTGSVGYAADSPVHTITAGGKQARPGTAITQGVVAAHLVHMGHGEGKAGGKRFSHGIRDVKDPLNTITAQGAAAGVVTTHMIKMRGDNVGSSSHEPLHTISAQGLHHGIVSTFLAKWAPDAHADASLPVLVTLDGEVHAVVDIGLRMLTPKELYRAQGFPENYAIEHGADGRPLTKTAQVRMCGNSVSPPNAAALVMANYSDLTAMSIAA